MTGRLVSHGHCAVVRLALRLVRGWSGVRPGDAHDRPCGGFANPQRRIVSQRDDIGEEIADDVSGDHLRGHLPHSPCLVPQRGPHRGLCRVLPRPQQSPRRPHAQPVALFWFPRRIQGLRRGVPTQQPDQAHIGIVTLDQAHTPGDERRPALPSALRFHPLPRRRTHQHPASMGPTTDDRAPHIRCSSAGQCVQMPLSAWGGEDVVRWRSRLVVADRGADRLDGRRFGHRCRGGHREAAARPGSSRPAFHGSERVVIRSRALQLLTELILE
jgi:hypothetical protein